MMHTKLHQSLSQKQVICYKGMMEYLFYVQAHGIISQGRCTLFINEPGHTTTCSASFQHHSCILSK